MNIIFFYLSFLFMFGSFFGWVLEFFFRRIFHKQWVNPGFLRGPYLPIYGFGLIILYIITMINLPIQPPFINITIKILGVGFIMTAIEYLAGLLFIKTMGIRLWDYSSQTGNINGIICPLFSIIWTIVGTIYVLFVHTQILKIINILTTNVYYPFVVGIFLGIFLWDLFSTLEISDRIRGFAKNAQMIVRYEDFKIKEKDYYKINNIRYNFFRPLNTQGTLMDELLIQYREDNKEK